MQREPVASECAASIGYDPTQRILEVEYHEGSVYRYLDVPPHEHQALMRAPSIGRHLNQHVKPQYAWEKE